ncbi:MAG: hypothetical protein WKF77_24740 [Planctomycetaceae bacterium]
MNADTGTNPGEKRPGVLEYLRPIALVVIVVVSGCFIWAVHSGDVFLICIALIVGGSLGLFAGLVAGVTLPETILTIGAFTGLFAGIVRGFTTYGVGGAIVGGPLGLVAGVIASIPLMMLLLLILCIGTGTGPGEQANNK